MTQSFRKTVFLIILLHRVSFSAFGLEFWDYPKMAPLGAKIIYPLTLIPEMFDDPDAIIPGAAGLGLFTLPNSILLYNVITENRQGTILWRKITAGVDFTAGIGFAGTGIFYLARNQNWDALTGMILLLESIPVLIFAGVDLFPYSFE